jgi:hypothetical protein
MRRLFLLLILTNLGFAVWSNWYAAPPSRASIVTDARTQGITLVSEIEDAAREALEVLALPAPEPLEATASEAFAANQLPVDQCVSVGPFQELAQASAAQAALRAAGFAPRQRLVEGDVWVGYWVHLPNIATRDEAGQMLSRLRENALPDAYIVPGGEEAQTVSLGVFSEISRAGAVREQVRQLGYDPTVVDRSRRATLYWLDVPTEPDNAIDLELLQTPGRINRLDQRPCAPIEP